MDEFYFDGEYVETRYFGYLANAEQDLGLYYEEGFLVEGYFDEAASSADLSCLSLRIKPLGSALSLSSELLSSVNYIANAAAGMTSQFTPSVIGGLRKPLTAALAAYSGFSARGFLRYERPLQLEFSNAGFSTIRKFGSHSLQFTGSDRTEFYVDNSYSINDLTIEFWVNCSSTNNQDIVKYEDTNGNLIWEVRLLNLRPAITIIDTGNVSRTATSSTAVTSGDWSFVKIERVTGTGPKIYVDGVLTVTGTNAVNKDPVTAQGRLVFGDDNAALSNFRVDEFRIIQGTTSNTVPTEEFINNNLTKALFHFNNDYTDDIAEIESGQATLSSSFVLAASLGGPVRLGSTTLTSLTSLSALGTRNGEIILEAFTNAALTVQADKLVSGEAGFNILGTVTAVNSRTRSFDSSADFAASQNVTALRIQQLSSVLTTISNMVANGTITDDVTVTLAALTALTAEPKRISSASASLSALAFELALGGRVVGITANLTAVTGLVINTNVLQITQYVYTIPNESRQYVIDEETREYEIFSETRLYNIRR